MFYYEPISHLSDAMSQSHLVWIQRDGKRAGEREISISHTYLVFVLNKVCVLNHLFPALPHQRLLFQFLAPIECLGLVDQLAYEETCSVSGRDVGCKSQRKAR